MRLMLACAAMETPPPEDVFAILTNPGAHGVGYRESEVTYADTIAGGERSLRLASWYPTDDASGADASYFRGTIPAPGVWQGASIAEGSHPLAVFSHGHQGYAENSSFLLAHLASHGWVVLAPDHTGNTTLDGSDRDTEIYAQRPLDISAVIDVGEDFGGTPEDVLVLGHSFGGYTTFALGGGVYDPARCPGEGSYCSTWSEELADRFAQGFADDRIAAYVAMAAGDSDLFAADGLSGVSPMFQMTATLDQGEGSEGDAIWDQLMGGENRRLILDGGGHQSFTDFADRLEDVPLEREVGFTIVNAYALAWAWASQGDERGRAWLNGEEEIDPAGRVGR